ncbi:MAG: methyltransferase domain-containing protein [Asgard group archaeon]|nr:methyltransferase domain-containing protein [Asgard group archaeon]
MAKFGLDFYLALVLIIFQLAVLSIFITLYVRKKQTAFLALIFSVSFFIIGNLLIILFSLPQYQYEYWMDFLQGLLAAAGLIPIVTFLEIFENGTSFTTRSSSLSIFILIVGAISGATKYAFPSEVGRFINLMSPMMFILVGSFFLDTIKKIQNRIRFENQKKKIRKIRSGIYLTFIIPKFIIGTIITVTVMPLLLKYFSNIPWLKTYDTSFLELDITHNIFEIVLNLIQTIGLAIMSLPIIYSKSVFFMQSRKVTDLIVINKDGIPIFKFQFELEAEKCDEDALTEAYLAISTLMKGRGIACQELKTMNFSDLEIMVEIRNNFAVLLTADRPTKFLSESIEEFADNFQKVYPDDKDLNHLKVQKLKYTAEKMVQTSFGLEDEEFEQIRFIVREGYDKVADEYLATRSEEDPEVKLLPDFMKRLPVGARILDAGCGAGDPITRILSEKFKVTGVDISRKQVEIARENLPFCEFIWQDMSTLTFPDEYFDGIVSYYAIPHIPREEHMGLLDNFLRMLKPNGLALLCFGTADDPGTVVDDFFGVKMYWSSFDAGTNIEMLKEVGYHVIWLKLIFDDVTDEQHIFVLAQKLQTEFLEEIKEKAEEEVPQK